MRLWWEVLLGCLAAWVALAVGVGLMLGWALWRHPPGESKVPEAVSGQRVRLLTDRSGRHEPLA